MLLGPMFIAEVVTAEGHVSNQEPLPMEGDGKPLMGLTGT